MVQYGTNKVLRVYNILVRISEVKLRPLLKCETWSSHDDEYCDYGSLRHDTVWVWYIRINVVKKSGTTIFVPKMWRQQVQLHGFMAQKTNHNFLNFALDDELQRATYLNIVPIDRSLVGSQSQSGRRNGDYAV
jgi:hypothetical protein